MKNNKITRKEFLKTSAFLGSIGVVATQSKKAGDLLKNISKAAVKGEDFVYPLNLPENIIYTTCLQCHISCDLKAKLIDGVLVKVDGNPYGPGNMVKNIDYMLSPMEAAKFDGKICPKGQAGIQTAYDPYRLTKVLKRNGPRGSNKWKTIAFEQAITEVAEGGKLFADIGEDREISGFKQVFALKDPEVGVAMKDDLSKIGKDFTVADFKNKHQSNLGNLIDPEHPDFGPKNNQFVFLAGRIQHGRDEFSKKFVNNAFGSVNWFNHTTICEQSHHIAYDRVTSSYTVDVEMKTAKWGAGKTHLKPDLLNAEFIIFFGTGAFEANFGVVSMAEKVTGSIRDRNFKFAVVDPRLSKTAAKAKWWVPIMPGSDGAFALGMIRWIIENERYDLMFLENTNSAAAIADKETCWSDASYLVKIEEGKPTKYLRADEAGIGEAYQFVVSRGGTLSAVLPGDAETALEGDIFVDTEINGIKVKSAFQLLKDSVFSKSLNEYADICGASSAIIETLADELTSHGKKAAVEFYRGACQHTNGFYNSQALIYLNLLIGNIDWKGGLTVGGGYWHEQGDKAGGPYDMAKLHSNKLSTFGIPVTREKTKYENSTLFAEGYPAKRPWYPISSNVYQEVIPSAGDGYPYNIKILFNHMGAPVYSTPAGYKQIEILKDVNKIPLLISCDIVIGEASMYSDYIFPDIGFFERWGFPHPVPDIQSADSKVRQPVIAPLTETVKIDGEEMPISMEAVMIAIAKKLGLSGFGKNGFADGMNLDRPEDYYLKLAANIANGDKPEAEDAVPNASSEEMDLFMKSRKHLPKSVFDYERWKKSVKAEDLSRIIFVLNRGGRFGSPESGYKDAYVSHQFKNLLRFYLEDVASAKHSGTGKKFSGLPIYEEQKDSRGGLLKKNGYELSLITSKEISQTQSRTVGNYWTLGLMSENWVMINTSDAQKLGLRNDDLVRVTSASNPNGNIDLGNGEILELVAKVKVAEGIRPGVVNIPHHFGHWAYGASDTAVDGTLIKGDKRRNKGISPNALMTIDPFLKNTTLSDPIGGSASFFDTFIKLVKV